MSRSYYWSYHRAVDALRFLDLAIVAGEPSEGMHKQLAKRYIASSYKSLKLIGGLLESAHKQRCLADYKLAEKLSLGFVNQHISKCKSICLKIDQAIDASQKNV
ncbi:hypothetical protein DVT68_07340 [Dyella solisilvae]|uniref:HEPN domain-containing protein n=1 Tax=Dyella solisilvae TaxID=1920168 RepID=A0A370K6U3_9GAMM|nr:hypothetical protein DVT68_07340 [Dyella solisilvae]